MNCEQVRDLLSTYLDNTLARKERQQVATHLQTCAECSEALADFRRFDALLTHLPRISPDASLHKKIFSSSEYLNLPGPSASPPKTLPHHSFQPPLHLRPWARRIMLGTLVAALLLTIGMGSFLGWQLKQKQSSVALNTPGITPPAGLSSGPIPAGLRFVFLRDGALWSAPTDGGTDIVRLSQDNVVVADNWAVRTPLPGRSAGNLIAYIDLQQGYIHTIRSDGQSDTVIPQPLLKRNSTLSSIWETEAGTTILNSLSWSKDGSMLAFVADPQGTGQPELYLYSLATGQTHQITLPRKGAVSQPVWSPDGVRVAFKLSYNEKTGILDYNTHNDGVLTLVSEVNTTSNTSDTVLALDWSPDATTPTITWSVGVTGHVHSIWSQRVGVGNASMALQLVSGDYVEASYSRAGNAGNGNWLLVSSQAGLRGDVISLDLTAATKKLTSGKQVSTARWSPDGTGIDYFDMLSSGMGTLHIISATSGNDTLVSANVASVPAPDWSHDGQRLAYSTGSHVQIVNIADGTLSPNISSPLKLQGSVTTLSWSVASPHQLVLAMDNGQPGTYLIDTQNNTSIQLDKESTNGPIWWTQIP